MTSAEVSLVDTSVAVAIVVADHDAHERSVDYVADAELGLAGHAFFETYSVITRLPAPLRRSPVEVAEILAHNFPNSRFLGASEARDLSNAAAASGIAGGSVYDALVGACAREHGLRLLSRDTRAADVYRALGVDFDLLA